MKLIVHILLILGLVAMQQDCNASPLENAKNKDLMKKFTNIYEASGVQQISDGRVVVIEDERSTSINHVLSFETAASLSEESLQFDPQSSQSKSMLNDLEGITIDANDNLFAITSFSRNKKGKLKQNRERLARFKIKDNLIADLKTFDDLGADIRSKMGVQNINIEAISFDATGSKLLIGFREPVVDEKSLIVVLENPNAIFDNKEKPIFSDHTVQLDLNGGGIRALDYDKNLRGFIIVNEIKNSKGKLRARFWLWSGNAGDTPRKINIPGFENIKNIEGITSVNINGESFLLIVSDDGKINKQKGSHYALLRYDQILLEK